ncbi:hypothetical protein CGX12_00375 [Zobellella denitrificans]|nr:hypothetical protein CGX12_00375 [Zobellella denitrificans]
MKALIATKLHLFIIAIVKNDLGILSCYQDFACQQGVAGRQQADRAIGGLGGDISIDLGNHSNWYTHRLSSVISSRYNAY